MADELTDYVKSKDIKTVAKAARELDRQSLLAKVITREEFDQKSRMSDKEIFNERNHIGNKKGRS
jgi:hypothetical protein